MSMFNDISCGTKDNKKECESNAKLVSLHARRFGIGQWSFICGNPYPIFLHIHILVVYCMYISAHMFPCLQSLCALDHSLMHASLKDFQRTMVIYWSWFREKVALYQWRQSTRRMGPYGGKMLVELAESGCPIFLSTTPLSRGRLKSKGHGN